MGLIVAARYYTFGARKISLDKLVCSDLIVLDSKPISPSEVSLGPRPSGELHDAGNTPAVVLLGTRREGGGEEQDLGESVHAVCNELLGSSNILVGSDLIVPDTEPISQSEVSLGTCRVEAKVSLGTHPSEGPPEAPEDKNDEKNNSHEHLESKRGVASNVASENGAGGTELMGQTLVRLIGPPEAPEDKNDEKNNRHTKNGMSKRETVPVGCSEVAVSTVSRGHIGGEKWWAARDRMARLCCSDSGAKLSEKTVSDYVLSGSCAKLSEKNVSGPTGPKKVTFAGDPNVDPASNRVQSNVLRMKRYCFKFSLPGIVRDYVACLERNEEDGDLWIWETWELIWEGDLVGERFLEIDRVIQWAKPMSLLARRATDLRRNFEELLDLETSGVLGSGLEDS